MVNKVYVYNDNAWPLDEIFKGNELHIDPNDYLKDKKGNRAVWDIYEANEYRGQYKPVPFDGSGKMVDEPKYHKKVKLIPVENQPAAKEPEAPTGYRCMAKECKHVSPSQEELEAHTKARHPNEDRLIMPEQDEVLRAGKKKSA